jgi:hypothetical protein
MLSITSYYTDSYYNAYAQRVHALNSVLENEYLLMSSGHASGLRSQNARAGQTRELVILGILLLLTSERACGPDTGTEGKNKLLYSI